MTRDDIIRIAREAGIPIEIDWAGRPSTLVVKDGGTYLRSVDDLERFAALVAAEKDQEIERLREALKESVELIETLCPLEGATVRKARRALQEQPR